MGKKRIVATAPIGQTAIHILEKVAPVETALASDEASLLALAPHTLAIVSRGLEGRVTKQIIEAYRELRVIGRPGAGYESVDVDAASERGIPVVYAPVGGFAVAEGAMALLLAMVKQVLTCDSIVRQGKWQGRYKLTTGDLAQHNLGVIGIGRIGKRFAHLAQAFDMTILGHDPFLKGDSEIPGFIEMVGLSELLARSHFISLHVPLTGETKGLINRSRISQMRPGAMLVNTARGGVIENLDVLADALESGQLAAVGLDVFPTEPPDVSHRIFRHPRLVCAPHLLGVSELAMERIYQSMATDMVAVLEGRMPRFCVNEEVFATRAVVQP
jgi:D-3-phosphoglycerate dehydrogenase / 2-oxoglutarate reductase